MSGCRLAQIWGYVSQVDVAAWVEIGAGLVTALGFPFAIFSYFKRKRIEARFAQRAADENAYAKLFDDYNDFLKLVIENPQVNLADEPLAASERMGSESDPFLRVKAISMFNIFLSIAERAFLLYKNASVTARREQWDGWQTYIVDVLSRPDIREMYDSHKSTYDRSFVVEVDQWLAQAARSPLP